MFWDVHHTFKASAATFDAGQTFITRPPSTILYQDTSIRNWPLFRQLITFVYYGSMSSELFFPTLVSFAFQPSPMLLKKKKTRSHVHPVKDPLNMVWQKCTAYDSSREAKLKIRAYGSLSGEWDVHGLRRQIAIQGNRRCERIKDLTSQLMFRDAVGYSELLASGSEVSMRLRSTVTNFWFSIQRPACKIRWAVMHLSLSWLQTAM